MKKNILIPGIAVSCALAVFVAGLIVWYLWFQSHRLPVTKGIDDPGTGGGRYTTAANNNARATKFETLDLDRDGKLSPSEFSGDRKPAEAAKWFERRDVNHDGFISREEYLPVMPLPEAR